MPSVRVRRGSRPYTSLFGEENVDSNEQQQEGASDIRRARSETLASLYRPPPGSPSRPPQEISQSQQTPESPMAHAHFDYLAPPSRELSPDGMQRYGTLRSKPSRIAGSILSSQRSQRHMRGRSGSNAMRSSMDSDDARGRGSITLEGSQADVVIQSDGHPGLIGSSLSVASSTPSTYDGSSSDELHHEDEIVEHLDVIGADFCWPSCASNSLDLRPSSRHHFKSGERGQFHPDVGVLCIRCFRIAVDGTYQVLLLGFTHENLWWYSRGCLLHVQCLWRRVAMFTKTTWIGM